MRGSNGQGQAASYEPGHLLIPGPADGWSPGEAVAAVAAAETSAYPDAVDDLAFDHPAGEPPVALASVADPPALDGLIAESAAEFEHIDDSLVAMLRKVQVATEEDARFLRAACVGLRADAEQAARTLVERARSEADAIVHAAEESARDRLVEVELLRADARRRLHAARVEARGAVRAHLVALQLLNELNERAESLHDGVGLEGPDQPADDEPADDQTLDLTVIDLRSFALEPQPQPFTPEPLQFSPEPLDRDEFDRFGQRRGPRPF